jgi:hypothetical protein
VTHEPIVPDAPVLKIRASGASDQDVDEISLGGVSLIGSVISIDLRAGARELTTATLVVEVIPDIETPAVIAPAKTAAESGLPTGWAGSRSPPMVTTAGRSVPPLAALNAQKA